MEEKIAVEALAALAHNSRLAIFRLLVPEGPAGLAAGEIGRRLGIAPNALSFHLTRLRYAGLVTVQRNGQHMMYAAAYDGMQRLMGFLTENCCQMDAHGCSSDCPEPLSTRKKQKRTLQKARIA